MPRVLRDELEGVDFYIAQGYAEIARDTLDRLREENGDHPEILARYDQLSTNLDTPITTSVAAEPALNEHYAHEAVEVGPEMELEPERPPIVEQEHDKIPAQQQQATVPAQASDYAEIEPAPSEAEEPEAREKEFLIQKESGPLYPDLLVQLNTSELHDPAQLEALRNSSSPPEERLGTDDLIDSLASGLDTSFDAIHDPREESSLKSIRLSADPARESESDPLKEQAAVQFDAIETIETKHDLGESSSARDELQEIFDELKEQTGDLKPLLDFETHYSLGLAYKDMDLLDDAISEFQMAFRTAGIQDLEGDYIHCCNMLGVCFKRKQMHKVAIMWFERGLKITGRQEDEYQALRFEIGLCYEEMGETREAIEAFTEVYGIDVNYRKVSEKLKQLQAAKR